MSHNIFSTSSSFCITKILVHGLKICLLTCGQVADLIFTNQIQFHLIRNYRITCKRFSEFKVIEMFHIQLFM